MPVCIWGVRRTPQKTVKSEKRRVKNSGRVSAGNPSFSFLFSLFSIPFPGEVVCNDDYPPTANAVPQSRNMVVARRFHFVTAVDRALPARTITPSTPCFGRSSPRSSPHCGRSDRCPVTREGKWLRQFDLPLSGERWRRASNARRHHVTRGKRANSMLCNEAKRSVIRQPKADGRVVFIRITPSPCRDTHPRRASRSPRHSARRGTWGAGGSASCTRHASSARRRRG